MKTVKKVACWIAYIVVGLIKLPFSITSSICTMMELYIFVPIMVRIVDASHSETLDDGYNLAMQWTAEGANNIAEYCSDLRSDL